MNATQHSSDLVGFKALSEHLRTLGIGASPDGLETRRRRYGLPPSESARGRPVHFGAAEVAAWVFHLTGIELDLWVQQHGRAKNARLVGLAPRRRAPTLSTRGLWLPHHFYSVMVKYDIGGKMGVEDILRMRGGATYSALTAAGFEERVVNLDTSVIFPMGGRYWRYDYARIATAADLHQPRYDHRRKKDLSSKSLIVAVRREGKSWTKLLVPGSWFGCQKGSETLFALTNRWPKFPELCAALKRDCSDAVLMAFSRRVELKPLTLDVMTSTETPTVSLPPEGAAE